MQIDYYAYRSELRGWNAAFKVSVAFGTLCFVIALNQMCTSLFVAVFMGMLTLFVGKTPCRVYFQYMQVPLFFMIFSCAAIALSFGREPAGEWSVSLHFFYLYLTRDSLHTAAGVFLNAVAGMSALYMLSFSTPMHEIILVLQKAHLPRLLTELMNLIYRYIFILFEAAGQMQTAAKARLGYRNFAQSCRSFAAIGGSLFVISLKKANAYYDALLARGYNGRMEFLTEEKPVKLWQVVCGVLYFAGIILSAYLTG